MDERIREIERAAKNYSNNERLWAELARMGLAGALNYTGGNILEMMVEHQNQDHPLIVERDELFLSLFQQGPYVASDLVRLAYQNSRISKWALEIAKQKEFSHDSFDWTYKVQTGDADFIKGVVQSNYSSLRRDIANVAAQTGNAELCFTLCEKLSAPAVSQVVYHLSFNNQRRALTVELAQLADEKNIYQDELVLSELRITLDNNLEAGLALVNSFGDDLNSELQQIVDFAKAKAGYAERDPTLVNVFGERSSPHDLAKRAAQGGHFTSALAWYQMAKKQETLPTQTPFVILTEAFKYKQDNAIDQLVDDSSFGNHDHFNEFFTAEVIDSYLRLDGEWAQRYDEKIRKFPQEILPYILSNAKSIYQTVMGLPQTESVKLVSSLGLFTAYLAKGDLDQAVYYFNKSNESYSPNLSYALLRAGRIDESMEAMGVDRSKELSENLTFGKLLMGYQLDEI